MPGAGRLSRTRRPSRGGGYHTRFAAVRSGVRPSGSSSIPIGASSGPTGTRRTTGADRTSRERSEGHADSGTKGPHTAISTHSGRVRPPPIAISTQPRSVRPAVRCGGIRDYNVTTTPDEVPRTSMSVGKVRAAQSEYRRTLISDRNHQINLLIPRCRVRAPGGPRHTRDLFSTFRSAPVQRPIRGDPVRPCVPHVREGRVGEERLLRS
jgi:hypothetical protein